MGDCLIGGEESLAIKLLLRHGWDVIYEPSIRVKHRIHHERLTLPWMSKRAYWEGMTEIAIFRAMGETFPVRLAVPKLAAAAVILGGLFLCHPQSRFPYPCSHGGWCARRLGLHERIVVCSGEKSKSKRSGTAS